MNAMNYKGYIGTIDFSEKDMVFYGKVEGVNGLVNFEGDSVVALVEAFHEAVDDYLAYCAEEGIDPQKSYSGSLNVRISPETHCQVAALAKLSGMSINAFIRKAVEKEVACHL
ncbi:MAG: type II toxin-antitoxin system HicB family antitoxin [Bacteroidales bacterium]|nr:type II toxin-antitoxin system HicB family antitoxin [Bacteroidales bacterium]